MTSITITGKIKKGNFFKNKKLFKIDNMEAELILVFKKESYGTKKSIKYFFRYGDNDVVRPLCIKLPQIIGYVKFFYSTEAMSFQISDKKLLKKYTKIWGKIRSLMNKELDSESV